MGKRDRVICLSLCKAYIELPESVLDVDHNLFVQELVIHDVIIKIGISLSIHNEYFNLTIVENMNLLLLRQV